MHSMVYIELHKRQAVGLTDKMNSLGVQEQDVMIIEEVKDDEQQDNK